MESLPIYFQGILGILLLTCFAKIATTLSILRFGIGLQDSAFGLVILAISLAFTFMVMDPYVEPHGGWDAMLWKSSPASSAAIERRFAPFLTEHADETVVQRLSQLMKNVGPGKSSKSKEKETAATEPVPEQSESAKQNTNKTQPGFYVLASSFLITELRAAFYVGLVILIPFLVIDLLVTTVLMSLGITQISYAVAALPLKILVFFSIDGWSLVTEKIISGYAL